jgi:hypothetical protein
MGISRACSKEIPTNEKVEQTQSGDNTMDFSFKICLQPAWEGRDWGPVT